MTSRSTEQKPRLSPLAAGIVIVALVALAAGGYLGRPPESEQPGASTGSETGRPAAPPTADAETPEESPEVRRSEPRAEAPDPGPSAPKEKTPPPKAPPKSENAPKKDGAASKGAGSNGSQEAPDAEDRLRIPNVVLRDQSGKVVYRGEIDLKPTLERIEAGEKHSHRNDGAVFQNREGRLPKKPSGYYHEYVHPTPNVSGPGPQRVILGGEGEVYYTSDHYKSFKRIR